MQTEPARGNGQMTALLPRQFMLIAAAGGVADSLSPLQLVMESGLNGPVPRVPAGRRAPREWTAAGDVFLEPRGASGKALLVLAPC